MGMRQKVCGIKQVFRSISIHKNVRVNGEFFGGQDPPTVYKGPGWLLGNRDANLHACFVADAVIHQKLSLLVSDFRRPITSMAARQRGHRTANFMPMNQVTRMQNAETTLIMPKASCIGPILASVFQHKGISERVCRN